MALIIALLLIFIVPAFSQQAPENKALSDEVIQQINSKLECRVRELRAEEKIKELQAQLDALKPKEAK